MLSATTGRPPMAYTSESELVAATRPKSYGSSTMGVKKSTVSTIAISSREAIDPGVVAARMTHEHVGINRHRQLRQYLAQSRCAEFGGSTGACRELGQLEQTFLLAHGSSPPRPNAAAFAANGPKSLQTVARKSPSVKDEMPPGPRRSGVQ